MKYTFSKRHNDSGKVLFAVLCGCTPLMADTSDRTRAKEVLHEALRNDSRRGVSSTVEYWDGCENPGKFVSPGEMFATPQVPHGVIVGTRLDGRIFCRA